MATKYSQSQLARAAGQYMLSEYFAVTQISCGMVCFTERKADTRILLILCDVESDTNRHRGVYLSSVVITGMYAVALAACFSLSSWLESVSHLLLVKLLSLCPMSTQRQV
jgi:hypothetical protein